MKSTIETIHQCNRLWGETTLHPLVSVIDLSKANGKQHISLKLDFYTIWLKEYKCECFVYGRKCCDYSDGTLLFLAPGDSMEQEKNCTMLNSQGWLLAFHPDLINCTSLGQHIQDYTFFNYRKEESLHLSLRERKKVIQCMEEISEELHKSIDTHSKTLVSRYLELLFDHCARFYDRQFIVRCEENKMLVRKIDQWLDEYFLSNRIPTQGLPTAQHCADLLNLSPAYFKDLLKHETGKTLHEYLQLKSIAFAQKLLMESHKSVVEIAREIGFPSPECFNIAFKKITGHTPDEFRLRN